MRFFTVEKLGPNRAMTPEGYLLCTDVPLARTGEMIYGPQDDLPIRPKPGDERIIIHRRPEDVFAPIALASLQGKPFVDDHPTHDVTPKTWAQLAKGIVINPRRGEGEHADCIVGDIMVTDPDAIEGIKGNDKAEISLGYDADYEQTGPGEGLQKNFIYNHAAWVDSGRCGPRCKIGDSTRKGMRMSKFTDVLMRAWKAKDAAEVEKLAEEMNGGEDPNGEHHVHVHLPGAMGMAAKGAANVDEDPGMGGGTGGDDARIAALEAKIDMILKKLGAGGEGMGDGESEEEKTKRMEKEAADKKMSDEASTIEGALEMEAPPGTGDQARKAKDSAYLADAWQLVISQAEIIAPGARMPTFDSAVRPAVTYTTLCGMREELLARAYEDAEVARTIDAMNGNRKPDFKRMTCDAARVMLASVAADIGRRNNGTKDSGGKISFGDFVARQGSGPGSGVKGNLRTPADLNALAAKLYGIAR